jgi:serine/threonine protein kinase
MAADGTFKLMDFGLVTCVKKRMKATDSYEMTGFTGSLRYMAPEVALSQPYTEKADVYSFGIVLWQMARDRIPFKGLNKEEFMQTVVHDGDRPKLDSSWPSSFSSLLCACWNRDPLKRPSFDMVLKEIDNLLHPYSVSSHLGSPTGTSKPPISGTNSGKNLNSSNLTKPKSEYGVTSWF